MLDFSGIKGFEWDEWNAKKNWEKHKVRPEECEEAFFNRAFVARDEKTFPNRRALLSSGANQCWTQVICGFYYSGRQNTRNLGSRYEPKGEENL